MVVKICCDLLKKESFYGRHSNIMFKTLNGKVAANYIRNQFITLTPKLLIFRGGKEFREKEFQWEVHRSPWKSRRIESWCKNWGSNFRGWWSRTRGTFPGSPSRTRRSRSTSPSRTSTCRRQTSACSERLHSSRHCHKQI